MAIGVNNASAMDSPPTKVNVIFDTDMGPDYDDVGAITLLHAFADSGYVKILATMACTKYEGVAGVINVLNTYFKRPDIPIGVPKGWAYEEKDKQHWTDTLLEKYPHTVKINADMPDAVKLYRKILAGQPDNSVTIITVGFFTNINNLWNSAPDEFSNLTGAELIRQKVKQMVSMAGKFPAGREFNVYKDSLAAYQLFSKWDIPTLFTGWEIGSKIKTGLRLINNKAIQNSPIKDVFRIAMPQAEGDKDGRMSWDQTAVLIAVKNSDIFFNVKHGNLIVQKDGSDKWVNDNQGRSGYVTLKMNPDDLAAYIEKLMMHQPGY